MGVAKLFFDLCWINSLGDVLERRFDFDARQWFFWVVGHATELLIGTNNSRSRRSQRRFFTVPRGGV